MNELLSSDLQRNLIIFFTVALIITATIIIVARYVASNKVHYSVKDSLLTDTEKEYYRAFLEIFGDRYVVLPQINLASVINKDSQGFRSELFRNIDFGVFDHDYTPLVLIEINDRSHLREDRKKRDVNVKRICKKARIPLVTFWTKDGVDKDYFESVFKRIL